jgi:hypothetical protein
MSRARVEGALVEQIVAEWAETRVSDGDAESESVRLAVLLEDVFDVTLTDAEIDVRLLADPALAAETVRRAARRGR